MQEVFSKIIEKLEEIRIKKTCNTEKCNTKELCRICVVDDAIEIVKQEAEKCRNGWIPCSERLPEGRQDVLVCFDNIDGYIIAWYAPNGRTWRDSLTENICKADPIAWMNLPAPYQPKGE